MRGVKTTRPVRLRIRLSRRRPLMAGDRAGGQAGVCACTRSGQAPLLTDLPDRGDNGDAPCRGLMPKGKVRNDLRVRDGDERRVRAHLPRWRRSG